MNRSYKNKQYSTKKRNHPEWSWMLIGLSIGLSVALLVYYVKPNPITKNEIPKPQPASMASPLKQESQGIQEKIEKTPIKKTEPRFSFYNMLPNFEVIVPEEESDVTVDQSIDIINKPGIYVLQAGSFTNLNDADRRKARLALLGIESKIQKISIDERTYHRIRIGPITDLYSLNNIREQLRKAHIEVLRIRLGD